MFGDWDDKEWWQFDNYMINCLKSYLTTGLVKSNLVNAKKKKLIQEAGEDFVDWCGVINDASESEYISKS